MTSILFNLCLIALAACPGKFEPKEPPPPPLWGLEIIGPTISAREGYMPFTGAFEIGENSMHPLHQVFAAAGIPKRLWGEYAAVGACESRLDTLTVGDGGLAEGLFQIHWGYLWAPWGNEHHPESFTDPYDPVQNARLAYLIGQDSVKKGLDRWHWWSAKPWPVCQVRAEILMKDGYNLNTIHNE